jgi:hypothetical protein
MVRDAVTSKRVAGVLRNGDACKCLTITLVHFPNVVTLVCNQLLVQFVMRYIFVSCECRTGVDGQSRCMKYLVKMCLTPCLTERLEFDIAVPERWCDDNVVVDGVI